MIWKKLYHNVLIIGIFKWISRKENTIWPHFQFLPNFSGRNWKKLFLPGGENSGKKTQFFPLWKKLANPGEPQCKTWYSMLKCISADVADCIRQVEGQNGISNPLSVNHAILLNPHALELDDPHVKGTFYDLNWKSMKSVIQYFGDVNPRPS